MRILFLINNLRAGGAERVCALLANAWSRRGHAVTVMPTYVGDDYRNDFEFDDGIELKPLACEPDMAGSRTLSRIGRIRREIRDSRCDAVVSFLVNENIKAIIAGAGTGIPVVISERSHPPATPVGLALRALRRATYPFASRLVMQTQAGVDWAQQRHLCRNAAVIPNPLAYPIPATMNPIELDEVVLPGRKLLLAVGRLHSQKRLDAVIRAFAGNNAMKRDWMLVILGEGEERERLEFLSAGLAVRGIVRLPGRAGNMHDWYSRADGFVLASAYEGYPNALLEALAYGVRAVATDCETGPRELIEGNPNSILIPNTDDPHTISDGLDRLTMLDPTASDHLAAAVRDQHSLDAIADQWLSLLAGCAGETGQS